THKGSLFLDEIGSLPMDLQGKLLRVLQEGEHLPIGRDQPVKTDLRFIAATNEDIEEKISLKTFRKDLYYRLKGAWLHLPSLKERKGDIPLLAAHFLAASDHNSGEPLFHPDTMALLEAYPYPGNIRELKSIVQGAFNLSRGRTILVDHLPSHFRHQPIPSGTEQGTWVVQPLEELEKQYVLKVYNHTGKNKSRTSALLGIGLNTLRRKLRTYGMK
ncbi:MAG: sigma 54-interacting transcriptional regulator, partial [Proteobacteria bacterium]|nr:sigma 54-interacting transcriptional regulator [Pseudomonadota bacterium]